MKNKKPAKQLTLEDLKMAMSPAEMEQFAAGSRKAFSTGAPDDTKTEEKFPIRPRRK
jgi:hypothetical protein